MKRRVKLLLRSKDTAQSIKKELNNLNTKYQTTKVAVVMDQPTFIKMKTKTP